MRDDYLVLRRRDIPSAYEMTPLATRTFRLGEIVGVPAVSEGLLWAELTVRRTPLARILNLVYHVPKMTMTVSTRRSRRGFTLLDETAGAGFLLSPFIPNTASMAEVYQRKPLHTATEDVVSLSIVRPPEAAGMYESEAKLKFYTLHLQSPAVVPATVLRAAGLDEAH